MAKLLSSFWAWYEKHYTLNISVALGLFLLQLVHLYWMTTHVVALRLFGQSFFTPSGIWQSIIVIVDYAEIPALAGTSLIYINELHKGWNWRSLVFLVLINSQWLHLFWITDEYVLRIFLSAGPVALLPTWLAWIAICIDYLELPVIADTIGRVWRSVLRGERISLP